MMHRNIGRARARARERTRVGIGGYRESVVKSQLYVRYVRTRLLINRRTGNHNRRYESEWPGRNYGLICRDYFRYIFLPGRRMRDVRARECAIKSRMEEIYEIYCNTYTDAHLDRNNYTL